jgi:hypothetical protein
MKEIITLQFGSTANFVGTHYWNTQDELFSPWYAPQGEDAVPEINHQHLYRTGYTEKYQETYTPRMVLFDIKGNLGSLRAGGYQYNQSQYVNPEAQMEELRMNGYNVDFYASEKEEKNAFLQSLHEDEYGAEDGAEGEAEYEGESAYRYGDNTERARANPEFASNETSAQTTDGGEDVAEGADWEPPVPDYQLDKVVKVWSDYLKVHLHPRSVQTLPFVQEGGFELFGAGNWSTGGMVTPEISEEAFDRVRFFLEEADSIQGFQCFVDFDSGFGGFAQDLLQELKDECRTSAFVAFSVMSPSEEIAKAEEKREKEETAAAAGGATAGGGAGVSEEEETGCMSSVLAKQRVRRRMNEAMGTHALLEICQLHVPLRSINWETRAECR